MRGALSLSSIVATALFARYAAWLLLDGYSPPYDPASYVELAQSVIDGNGLVIENEIYGTVRAMYPPAYPVLLAGFGSIFGLNAASITVLNTLIDLAAAWTVLRLGNEAGQRGSGFAVGIYLLWPSMILSAPIAQKEGLTALFAVQVMWALVRAAKGGPFLSVVAHLGISAGLLVLTQPALAPLAPCVALALIPASGWRKMAVALVFAAPFVAAVMSPWWFRNWLLFGQFVPLTASSGHSLMRVVAGLHQPLPTDVVQLPETERAAKMAARAVERMKAAPSEYLRNVAWQAWRAISDESFAVRRLYLGTLPWLRLTLLATYFTSLGLAAFGALRRPNRLLLLLLAGCLLSMLVGVWFEFSERHRWFLTPILLLLAAPLATSATERPAH